MWFGNLVRHQRAVKPLRRSSIPDSRDPFLNDGDREGLHPFEALSDHNSGVSIPVTMSVAAQNRSRFTHHRLIIETPRYS